MIKAARKGDYFMESVNMSTLGLHGAVSLFAMSRDCRCVCIPVLSLTHLPFSFPFPHTAVFAPKLLSFFLFHLSRFLLYFLV